MQSAPAWDDATWLMAQAYLIGFDAVGIARVDSFAPHTESMCYWVWQGHQGAMQWMQRTLPVRLQPQTRWSDLRAIIVVAATYPAWVTLSAPLPDRGKVSAYAWGRDYHRVLGRRLDRLVQWAEHRWPDAWFRTYVDTGPVAEKLWAVRAGIGWLGKHSNLIHPRLGSWLFLGVILTSKPLPERPHLPIADRCGTCTRCMDVCPTAAIIAPGVVSARRCISYWTIEHPGPIPVSVRPAIGAYLFGCDDCQTVCPWNRWAQAAATFVPYVERMWTDPLKWLRMSTHEFEQQFRGTPLRRLGLWRIRRNALIVLGNRGTASVLPDLETYLRCERDPVLREHAQWAVQQIRMRCRTVRCALRTANAGLDGNTG